MISPSIVMVMAMMMKTRGSVIHDGSPEGVTSVKKMRSLPPTSIVAGKKVMNRTTISSPMGAYRPMSRW